MATLVVSYKFQNLYLFQIYNSILNSIAYSLIFLQCLTSIEIVQHTLIIPSQQCTIHDFIVFQQFTALILIPIKITPFVSFQDSNQPKTWEETFPFQITHLHSENVIISMKRIGGNGSFIRFLNHSLYLLSD